MTVRLLTRDGEPVSFSKEFARGMVTERDQQFSQTQANEIAVRYIEGLQHLLGTALRAGPAAARRTAGGIG
jgi:hypothetical protein